MTDEVKDWIVEHNDAGKESRIPVQAAQVSLDNMARVATWCRGTFDATLMEIAIWTPFGVKFAGPSDWIIKAPDGSFRVATAAQWSRSYEKP